MKATNIELKKKKKLYLIALILTEVLFLVAVTYVSLTEFTTPLVTILPILFFVLLIRWNYIRRKELRSRWDAFAEENIMKRSRRND